MIRCTVGLMALLSLGLACSSKSIDDDDPGSAGSASGGTGSGSAMGGSSASTAGAGGVVGRAGSSATAGASTAGGMASGGTPAGECAEATVTCVDDATASVCDPLTGETETANCAEELAKEGLISDGCTVDETGSGCTITGLADAECEAGTPAFAVCVQATQDELFDIYVACFLNNMDVAHEAISCYADYVDEAAMTVDCDAAEAACLPPQ